MSRLRAGSRWRNGTGDELSVDAYGGPEFRLAEQSFAKFAAALYALAKLRGEAHFWACRPVKRPGLSRPSGR